MTMFGLGKIMAPLKRALVKLFSWLPNKLDIRLPRWLTLSVVTISCYLIYKDVQYLYKLRNRAHDLAAMNSNISGAASVASSSSEHPVNVKLTTMFSTLQFVDMPLARWTLTWLPVQNVLAPNTISVLGVIAGIVTFFMLLSENLAVRQSAFILFRYVPLSLHWKTIFDSFTTYNAACHFSKS